MNPVSRWILALVLMAPALTQASELGAALLQIYQGDAAQQREGLAALERRAADGADVTARDAHYLLGAIHIFGGSAMRTPIERDLDLAARHFEQAGNAGNVNAMAYMAEIDLARGRYREAMDWAQAYLLFARRLWGEQNAGAGYGAGLLHRAMLGLGKARRGISRKETARRFEAFLAEHGPAMEAGLALPQLNWISPDLSWSGRGRSSVVPDADLATCPATLVEYFYTVTPDGRLRDLYVLSSLPCSRAAESLQRSVFEHARFNGSDGDGLRFGYLATNFFWEGSNQPKLRR